MSTKLMILISAPGMRADEDTGRRSLLQALFSLLRSYISRVRSRVYKMNRCVNQAEENSFPHWLPACR